MSASHTYLDHAASTPVRPEVREAMLPYLGAAFGNPSSGHWYGREARAGLERARHEVAEAVGCDPGEVFFTSGGTEADNLAIVGRALAEREAGRRPLVAVAATEHKAVLASAHAVARWGGEEEVLPVDGGGQLERGALDAVLARAPAVVSVMWVNNETGVLHPVGEIGAQCEDAGVHFHSDMVQALGKVAFEFRRQPLSLASLSGHKIGGPKGVGALIVRRGVTLVPLVTGGSQQRGLRPGTENIAGAVGLGRAAQLAAREGSTEPTRLTLLRQRLLGGLRAAVPDLVETAAGAAVAPHLLSVLVPGAETETLLMHLDLAGIAASGGSACSTGAMEPSHVLTAMGIPVELARGVVRFSLGHETTGEDVDRAIAAFPGAVARARELAEAMSRG